MNSDGTLTALSGSPFSISAWNIAVSKNFLLAATTDLVSYQIDPASGALTKASSVPIPGAPTPAGQSRALAADANNAYAFGKDGNANYAIHGFSVAANGSLTTVAGSPFLFGNGCDLCDTPFVSTINSSFLMIGADGFHSLGDVTVFARGTGGTLAPKQTLGSNIIVSVAIHPSGKFGYAVDGATGSMMVLNIAANGQPSMRTSFFDSPNAIFKAVASEPGGKFLLAVDDDGAASRLRVFAVNQSTGDLTEVGSPVSTGGTRGSAVTVDPTNHFAIVSNGAGFDASQDLVVFSFNPDTGAVTKIKSVPSGGQAPQMPFMAVL